MSVETWCVGVSRFVARGMKEEKKRLRKEHLYTGTHAKLCEAWHLDIHMEMLESRASTDAPMTRKEMRAMPKFMGPEAEMQGRRWLRIHRQRQSL